MSDRAQHAPPGGHGGCHRDIRAARRLHSGRRGGCMRPRVALLPSAVHLCTYARSHTNTHTHGGGQASLSVPLNAYTSKTLNLEHLRLRESIEEVRVAVMVMVVVGDDGGGDVDWC